MKTVTLQIGNSDDKLSQKSWSDYCSEIFSAVQAHAIEVHFFGAPPNHSPFQNVAFCFTINSGKRRAFKREVKRIRKFYRQDSAAYCEGTTIFV